MELSARLHAPTAVLYFSADPQLVPLREQVLTAAGFDVTVVLDVPQVEQAATHGSFDLLVLCPSLPQDWKDAATRRVRECSPNVLIVDS